MAFCNSFLFVGTLCRSAFRARDKVDCGGSFDPCLPSTKRLRPEPRFPVIVRYVYGQVKDQFGIRSMGVVG